MKYCLNCGKECCDILCESCQNTADIERLCLEISGYDVSSGENELWNRLASELQNPGNFRYAAFALAGFLASPRREYIQLRSLMNGYFLGTRSYNWLQAIAPGMLESDSLSVGEKEDVRGVLLGSYYSTHEYEKAEAVVGVGHDEDQRCFSVSKRIKLQFVICCHFTEFRNIEHCKSCSAGNEYTFSSLAGG